MVNLSELNEAQRQAVTCIDAPSLVIAGAGSGKTRVLTYKVAYLLEQGFKPWNILALTFTNKAAREMQQRIAKQLEDTSANDLWMGTFHSIFSRILRIEGQVLGFSNNFTIYDASDSKSLIRAIIRELGLDEKVYKPGLICHRISDAKNRLIFPDVYRSDADIQNRDYQSKIPATWEIYLRYMQRCRLSDAMDFDDLLLYTYYLFDKHPDVLQKYVERFHFVLVDEYQDTNFAQHQIVWQLTRDRQRVCVVGDDAQSIYSFRGANIDNILTFQKAYQHAQLFKLEQNYRSTQTIVNAANSLIAQNRGQIKKDVFSEKAEGNKIRLFNVHSDYEESIVVAQHIRSLHRYDDIPYNDIAILYRTNSQSRGLEEQLRKEGIPYRIYGGLSFYQRKEIKDVIAYLRLLVNPRDEEALKRVINYPARGIGDTTMQKIQKCASEHQVSLWHVLTAPATYELSVNKGTQGRLEQFAHLISGIHQEVDSTNAFSLTQRMLQESGVSADINRGTEADDLSRQENLQELLNALSAWVEDRMEQGRSTLLADYLQEVSLLSDLDEDGRKAESDAECLTLMTVHSAKGLEFRVVFVVGLEEELFPNQRALQEDTRGLEEERRLMYVAMTRAEEQLYLTCARSRFRFGKRLPSRPSRFLREIDARYLSVTDSSSQSWSSQPAWHNPREFAGSDRSGLPQFGRASSKPSFLNEPVRGHSSSHQTFSSGGAYSEPTTQGVTPKNVVGGSALFGRKLKRVSSLDTTASSPRIPSSSSPASSSSSSFTSSQVSSTSSTAVAGASTAIQVGHVVQHSRFGRGVVTSIEGTGLDTKATVQFDHVGTKQLLLRFAKLDVVE